MEYKDEFERGDLAVSAVESIKSVKIEGHVNLMEVCGTHTHGIAKAGIRSVLPENVHLLSGPGCPVCVTPNNFIRSCIGVSLLPDVIITTFGDMFAVPGSYSSLMHCKSSGADIRIVYSSYDALKIAIRHPQRPVIFLGVGFERLRRPSRQQLLLQKKKESANFFVLAGFKTLRMLSWLL